MKTLQVPTVDYIEYYWFDNNPALTHFMSSLSVLFPDGERFFMKTMNAYRNELPEHLKKELNEFCIQEANHGRVHTLLNVSLHTSPKLIELENRTNDILTKYTKYLNKKQKLAVTVCLEHLTAIMGKQLVLRTDLSKKMKSDLKNVWLYHANEEVEHAHVSFDVYKAIGGGYLLRASLMIPAIIGLVMVVLKFWKEIMKYDKKNGKDGLITAINILVGKNGFITKMGPDVLRWFKPGYHPSN